MRLFCIIKTVKRRVQAFVRSEAANATVEFVIIAPVLLWFVFSTFETGWLMTRKTMLDRGLNMAIRELRLGLIEDPDHAKLKARVCERTRVLRNCIASIHLELTPITVNGGIPDTKATCVDRSGEVEPVVDFSPGAREEIMFVRACLIVDPLLPGFGIGSMLSKDATGGVTLIAKSAFMNEP